MQMTRQDVVVGRDSGRAGHGFAKPLSLGALASAASRAAVAERQLLDAVERAQRRGAGTEALLLRLSGLPPPGARPHHRRVARALMDEAALRHGGQVFALRNLDLVLLGPQAGSTRALLAQLFGGHDTVVALLPPGEALLAYARERAADDLPVLGPPADPALPPRLGAAEALLGRTSPDDLLQAQVAAEMLAGGTLRPLFREVSVRLSALASRLQADGDQMDDPFPAHDLAAPLGARTLDLACTDLVQGGSQRLALHLNLPLSAVLTPAFARLAEIVHARGGRAGIELDLVEALADPAAFERAKERVRAAGFTLALDGIGHEALLLTYPGRLGADLVKLEWSDALRAAGPDAEAALREIGPARIVLTGADGETAMRWGYARGLRRFQGRHVDAMLAASRLGACAFTDACTLRLCAERASAVGAAGRTGCRNAALLDAAAA